MKCPICPEVTLTMTERQGIEIDYCPQCRGVWLDRGELDKLIEKSTPSQPVQQPQSDYRDKHEYHGDSRKDHHYKKRKSFLSEIFD